MDRPGHIRMGAKRRNQTGAGRGGSGDRVIYAFARVRRLRMRRRLRRLRMRRIALSGFLSIAPPFLPRLEGSVESAKYSFGWVDFEIHLADSGARV